MDLDEAFRKAAGTNDIVWKLDQGVDLDKEWGVAGLDNQGVCQGLCLCHAGLAKSGQETRGSNEADGRRELYAYANHAQQYFQEVGNPDNMAQVKRMYDFLGKFFNVKVKCDREFSLNFDYTSEMADFAWSKAPGYFQVLLPNHVVCFHLAQEITYFDPNCGMVRFNTQNQLSKFMKEYHMSAPFKELYDTEFGQTNARPLFVVGLE